MRLWRISDFADLSGEGGLFADGRWHSRGRRVVYLSDHPAAALLEVIVHLEVDAEDVPATYRLLAIEVPDDIAVERVPASELPSDWTTDRAASRARGDAWIAAARTALLDVPSAIVPYAKNWLFNPAHAEAGRIHVADAVTVPFDGRLLR